MRAIALVLVLVAACSPVTAPARCTPGVQIPCACPGGSQGAQACAADGEGYGACACPDGGDVVDVVQGVDVVPDRPDATPEDRPDVVDAGELVDRGITEPDVVPVDAGGTEDVHDAGANTCASGTTFCSGSCVNTQTDSANCGACGMACASTGPHTVPSCRFGGCQFLACETGWTDCAPSAPGCETNTSADPMNCGACGRRCSIANASSRCAFGTCTIEACNAGFADCNGNPADGCEVETGGNDRSNCGACARPCTNEQRCDRGVCLAGCIGGCGPGEVCTLGACTRCPTGTVACNGVCRDTRTDPTNCGACGNACGAGRLCLFGACR